ncbi:hypothetical protein JTB14_017413 [Gonioctena quinquepunctata]|nr:hypothetical protein JTB14_017413 [Gonioctena quinquepunctata]
MRIISGSIKPTTSHWLPILSNIPPPHLRRSNTLCREFDKIQRNPLLKIHEDIAHLRHRLCSVKPPIQTAETLTANNSNLELEWKQVWHSSVPHSIHDSLQINQTAPGFTLSRKTWTSLNRGRTSCGVCADSLFRRGKSASSTCDCGMERRTIHHLAYDCKNRPSHCTTEDFLRVIPTALNWIQNLGIEIQSSSVYPLM